MKRVIALIMVFILCIPCVFAEDMKTELTQVTLKVKEALDIGDQYTDFSSSFYDDLWNLYWYSDSEEVSVSCDAEGHIYNYYYYDLNYSYDNDFAPRYPDLDEPALRDIANAFLAGVITGEGEGWVVDEVTSGIEHANTTRVYVTGRITMLDVPTDICFSLFIEGATGKVTSFYRDDEFKVYTDFSGDMTAVIDEAAAMDVLKPNTSMELVYYVVDSGEMARLVYLPVTNGRYIVRASDGALIDISDGYGYDGAYEASAAGVSGGYYRELTEAELEGIGMYDNAMNADEIDAVLRNMPELGLTDDYVISTISYSENNGKLSANIIYERMLTDSELELRGISGDSYDEKSFVIGAVDGKLESAYSYYPGKRTERAVQDAETAEDIAHAFIEKYYPEYAEYIVLNNVTINDYGSESYTWSNDVTVSYSRSHNGYAFHANGISISVDCETGYVDGMYIDWDDNQEFDEPSADMLMSAEQAQEIYLQSFVFENVFASVPCEKIGDWDNTYELCYAWQYRKLDGVYAVDAVTGTTYSRDSGEGAYEYSDIAGNAYEAEIAMLGSYGIGFSGGEFMPDAPFTARDALIFINQAYDHFDVYGVEARDYPTLMYGANDLGAEGLEIYPEDYVLSAYDFAVILLGMSGYEKAIAIPGIYACGFADDAGIEPEDYPVIAIAYGLGLIDVDESGNINAYEPLTRAEGAHIYHNLLSVK